MRARLKRVLPFSALFFGIFGLAWLTLNAEMGSSNRNLNASEQAFLKRAAQQSMADMALGRLALEKSESAEVKSLGRRMIDDHGAISANLIVLARKKGVELPPALDDKYRAKLELLRDLNGPTFDKAYLECLESMHDRDVVEFKKIRITTTDEDLQKTLDQALPLIREHAEYLKVMPAFSRN